MRLLLCDLFAIASCMGNNSCLIYQGFKANLLIEAQPIASAPYCLN